MRIPEEIGSVAVEDRVRILSNSVGLTHVKS